jgi:hypothetical protein
MTEIAHTPEASASEEGFLNFLQRFVNNLEGVWASRVKETS